MTEYTTAVIFWLQWHYL